MHTGNSKKMQLVNYLVRFRQRLDTTYPDDTLIMDASFIGLILLIISHVSHTLMLMMHALIHGFIIATEVFKFLLDWLIDILSTRNKSSVLLKGIILTVELTTIIFLLYVLIKALFIPIITIQIYAANELLKVFVPEPPRPKTILITSKPNLDKYQITDSLPTNDTVSI